MTGVRNLLVLIVVLSGVLPTVHGHGFMTDPRCHGALRTNRKIPKPVIDPAAPIDFCPHCQNCGGTAEVSRYEAWRPFAPFEYKRKGITLCGDPVGKNDHTRSGRFANPSSTPYVRNYQPGSIANFEYAITAHHKGFIEFYLCDISETGDVVHSVQYFKENCYALERSPHPSCESGNDRDCGPVDPKFPGRFVLPCKTHEANQMLGGPNGKMAYKLPNVRMESAVILSYWLTDNTCTAPDGFLDNYKFPTAWKGCAGRGGGREGRGDCVSKKQTPEEFFNCASVQVGGGGIPAPPTRVPTTAEPDVSSTSVLTVPRTTEPSASTTADLTTPQTTKPTAMRTTKHISTLTFSTFVDASTKACADIYAQCGGLRWRGAVTCCDPEYVCVRASKWYHQCRRPRRPLVTPAQTTTTMTNARSRGERCAGPYQRCGGRNWSGSTECCSPGYYCWQISVWYHQCNPVR